MANDPNLTGTPTTNWDRITPGAAVSESLLSQVIDQAAAAEDAAEAAAADAAAAVAQATAAANSAAAAEAAALSANASATSANNAASAAAASAAAAQAAAEALEDVAAGQVAVSEEGGVQTTVQVIDFTGRVNLDVATDPGTVHVDVLGPERLTTTITESALANGATATGTVDLGASGFLHRFVSDFPVWLRLYATAADRTADNARAIDEDPTGNILADVILDSVLDVYSNPLVYANQDAGPTGLIYYAVTAIGEGDGDFGEFARDDFGNATASDIQLEDHAPTNPGLSGWTAWEETGGDPAQVSIDASTDSFPGQLLATAATNRLNRSNVDFDHTRIRVAVDLNRNAATSNCACVIGLCVLNEDISTWDDGDYLHVLHLTDGSTNMGVYIRERDIDGVTDTDLVTPQSFGGWGNGVSKRVIVELDGNTCNVYWADFGTGANEVLKLSATVPSNLLDANHQRIGIHLLGSGVLTTPKFIVLLPITEINLDITHTKVEEAA